MKKTVDITEDYITLGQLLKYTDMISSGGMAKWYLENHTVYLDGEVEQRRGKKIYHGSVVEFEDGTSFLIRQI
ncbi:S4 domain-containing protein YaaA [Carnobacteriaceae bacterium zg-ZUI78]|nr:S4 domain-containing protein YaaA [Carnobacteriaceae bacterium zg-ZUI78]